MNADPRSSRNVGATTHGNALSASIEAGAPLPVTSNTVLEPQAQLIYQRTHVNDVDVSARVNKTVSVYATAGYWFDLNGARQRTIEGNAGVRLSF